MKRLIIFGFLFTSFLSSVYGASLDSLYTKRVYGPFSQGWITLGKDGKEFSFVAGTGTSQYQVYKNGKIIKGYLSTYNPTYSPDGKRFAFVAQKQNKKYVIVNDGRESSEYTSSPNTLVYSPDSKHLSYVIGGNPEYTLIQDNLKVQSYPNIMDPVIYSPDSKTLSYIATNNYEIYFLVMGNKVFDSYTSAFPVYSPINNTYVLIVEKSNGKHVVVRDGVEGTEYDYIGKLVFSPDGNHFAFSVLKSGKCMVVRDGTEGKEYNPLYNADHDCISDLTYSPDSQHLSYNIRTDKGSIVINDSTEISKYNGTFFVSYLSNIGNGIVYVARNGKSLFDLSSVIIKDGKEFTTCIDEDNNSTYPLVDKDSQGMIFSAPAQKEGKCILSMDGKLNSRDSYDAIKIYGWGGAQKKSILAFTSKKNGKYYINIWTRK